MNDKDTVLEQNVSTLLEQGGDAPRMSDVARARVKRALVDQFAREAAPAKTKPIPWRGVAGGFAAAAAAALVVTHLGGGGSGAKETTGVIAAKDVGKSADGSTWILKGDAKVEELGPRHVRVRGTALLDVVPGKGLFTVETEHGRIEVLGTRFVVDATDDETRAAVVRGEVKLMNGGGDVVLHAGEQAISEHTKPPVRVPAPRLSHLVSWAAETRARLERSNEPVHHGTLFAKDPGVRSHPPWGEEYPLPMANLKVDVVVDNQVARVALDQTFHNDQVQDLEGTYRFAIPPDASLQRLAMYVDGKLQESAVVERMAARRIYEELVYRRVDPALLEWSGTGRLNLRVYPIPALQDKRLVLAYTQSLPKLYDDYTLAVPFPEIDHPVGKVRFDVRVKGCAGACEITSTSHQLAARADGEDSVVTYEATNETIGDSLVLHVRDPRKQPTVARVSDASGQYVMVRAPSDLPATTTGIAPYKPRTWVILDDVSASRSPLELRAQATMTDAFLRELDEKDTVSIVAFDVTARTLLTPTRVIDVDRAAVGKRLLAEGGVGATDFAVGLSAALSQLGGAPAEDANVVYLGDGVVTSGTRHLDDLRAQLVGHAHFVGVGVGDGPDTATLEALAGPTGGYATTIDLADDVGWRAFDLVAALHTARATGVSARLVDANGALVPSTTYLKSPQLADGEELELVSKLAGTGTPAAIELTGTREGQPWTQHIALASAKSLGESGYLPRLWASREIAAKLAAKHEPVTVPACASARSCKTEAEVREERDEALRHDIIALGKQYFLLSRHTSLLVLENDEMYKKFGVTQGSGQTWAPYALPPTIPVVKSTVPAQVAAAAMDPDSELVRAPVNLMIDYGSLGYDDYQWRTRDRWGGGLEEGEQQQMWLGNRGGAAWHGDVTAATSITAMPTGEVAGAAKLDEGKMGKKDDPNEVREAPEDLKKGAVDDGAAQPPMQSATMASGPKVVVTGADSARISMGMGGGRRGWIGNDDDLHASIGKGHFGGGRGMYWSQPYLTHLSTPYDATYDDLAVFVPALVRDDFDAWRAAIAMHPGVQLHDVAPAARTQLERARTQLASGVYRWDGFEIAVDATRHVGWHRTTDMGLKETASFDGTTWTRRYAELGIDVTRTLGDDAAAMLLAYAPMLVAEPAQLARYFDVKSTGAHQVSLVGAKGKPAFVMDFDDRDRLVRVADGAGSELVSIAWDASGPTSAKVAGRAIGVGFTAQAVGDAVAWAHGGAGVVAPSATIQLPIRAVATAQAAAKAQPSGSAAWRAAQRQVMASLWATSNRPELGKAMAELQQNGGLEQGDLVLGQFGLATMDDATFARMLGGFGTSPDRTIAARYAFAGRAYSKDRRASDFAHASEGGLIGQLMTLREATAYMGAESPNATKAADVMLTLDGAATELRVAAGFVMQMYGYGKPEEVARVWEAAAIGPYKNLARMNAAQALFTRGSYDAGADKVAQLVADLDLNALPPHLDPMPSWFAQSRRGTAGWQIVWAQLRAKVLAGDSFDHVVALLGPALGGGGDVVEVQTILGRAAAIAGDDVEKRVALAEMAMQRGQGPWAQQMLEPLVAKHPTRALEQLVAEMALAQGRNADALVALEAAQDLASDAPVDVNTVRAELGSIIEVAKRVAIGSTGAARTAAVDKALAWGAKWRAVDAANPAIDQQLGELLLAVDDKVGAWRQLSTVIERAPMEGQGYMTVAEVFERQGRASDAIEFWTRAMNIDQTNPTPRLRLAQALIAVGRATEGDAILDEIGRRQWHDVWSGVVYQAKALRDRGRSSVNRNGIE